MNVFEQIQEGDVVLDCGAYVGRFSHYFADKGAKVYAFEPSPILYVGLEKRFRKYPNVFIMKKGVYSENCKRKLFYHIDYIKADSAHKVKYLESSSIYSQKKNVSKEYFMSDFIDLSEFIRNLTGKVQLLKLNVEGSEYKVLNRLIDTGLIYKIDTVVVAFHNESIKYLWKNHFWLKSKASNAGVYDSIIKWDWWHDNRSFLMKIRKEYA